MAAGLGPGLVRVGTIVTGAGLVLAVLAMLPLVTAVDLPSVFWFLAMLIGVGLALILLGLFSSGRRRSRLQRTSLAPTSAAHPTAQPSD